MEAGHIWNLGARQITCSYGTYHKLNAVCGNGVFSKGELAAAPPHRITAWSGHRRVVRADLGGGDEAKCVGTTCGSALPTPYGAALLPGHSGV
jgi:hypothetical protein